MSGVSPAGQFAYVRTAAMDASPGAVLGTRAAQWLAPTATFMMASAPSVSEAVVSPKHGSDIPIDYTVLHTGIGSAIAGGIIGAWVANR